MKIGVMDFQGAFREHIQAINKCGCEAVRVRKSQELDEVQGLIISGGEIATTDEQMIEFKILDKIIKRAETGMPVFGMGMGVTLLAKEVEDSSQPTLGLMDITVKRDIPNCQQEPFEADLYIPAFGVKPVRAVFVSFFYIKRVKPNVGILCIYDEKIIMACQGNFLACSFHPKLMDDFRIYQYFIKLVENSIIY